MKLRKEDPILALSLRDFIGWLGAAVALGAIAWHYIGARREGKG